MRNHRDVQVLRQRPAAFRAAIGVLLDGYESKTDFLGATRRILAIVRDWRSFNEMECEAPRRAAIARQLREVERDSLRLMASLCRLSRHLDDYVHFFSPRRLVGDDPVFDLYRKAEIQGADSVPEVNTSGFYARLTTVLDFCRASLRAAGDGQGRGSTWLGTDSGGGTSIFKEHYGSAKWQLIYQSALLYADFQPDRLAATEGGPVHRFCAAMYEIASGDSDSEESAGLKRYVQFAVPRVRKLSVMSRELLQLRRPGPFRLSHSSPRGSSRDQRIGELQAEMRALHDELARGPKRSRRSNPS